MSETRECGEQCDGNGVISGYRIVCFGDEQWEYEGALQRMARQLASCNELVYVNSIGVRLPRPNGRDLRKAAVRFQRWAGNSNHHEFPKVLSPLTFPLYNSEAGVKASGKLVYEQLCHAGAFDSHLPLLLWVGLPTVAPIVSRLSGVPYFQHATDCQSAYPGVNRKVIAAFEEQLAGGAAFCATASERMTQRLLAFNKKTFFIEHSVDFETFQQALPIPAELVGLPRPILGYVGGITSWFDQNAIAEIATHHPDFSIVLVGAENVSTRQLRRFSNVHLVGPKPYAEIPPYVGAFDVCLLPRTRIEWQVYANPLVILEYFAMGKPVVSVDMPWVDAHPELFHTYRFGESPIPAVARALHEDSTLSSKRRVIAMARQHPTSALELSRYVDRFIAAKGGTADPQAPR